RCSVPSSSSVFPHVARPTCVARQINTACAFTNAAQGQIIVTKQVEGGNGAFTFSLTGAGGVSGSTVLVGGSAGATVTLTGSFTGLAANTTFTASDSVPSTSR